VHTLLLEEYGVSNMCDHHGQETGLNVTSTPAGESGPSAQDRYSGQQNKATHTHCARGFGGRAKKRRANELGLEISLVFMTIMLHVLTYVVCSTLFWNRNGVVRFDLKRFDLKKGLPLKTFVITIWNKLCRCDHSVLKFKPFSLPKNW